MFRKIQTGDTIYFEKYNDAPLNIPNVLKILKKYTVVSFNGLKYDVPVIEAAVSGFSNAAIKKTGDMSIENNMQPWQIRKQIGVPALKLDHIDLIEVAPLKASLKLYAGRMHVKRMMDLPLDPDETILDSHLPLMRHYCGIDNENTAELCQQLIPEIELRTEMGKQYGLDIRSKSDAQMAEAVVKKELETKHGIKAKRPKIESGTEFFYKAPSNLIFQTQELKKVFELYTSMPIEILSSGHTQIDFNYEQTSKLTGEDYRQYLKDHPKYKDKGFAEWKEKQKEKKLKITIGETTYTLGVGGIHSCEKSIRHVSSDSCIVRDYDVAAFYPNIILNNKLYPKHLGKVFLKVYNSLIKKRLKSKGLLKTLDKDSEEYHTHVVINESGKIIINGLFGKLGSKWSAIYSPDLMAQVTITGQLSLLMLIEQLELNGISVVSANTDGIVTKFHPSKEKLVEAIVSDWEFETNYEMEATDYESINSRDINNYIAVKKGEVTQADKYSDKDYKVKGKGAYADQQDHYYQLRNNPSYDICSEAVKIFLKTNKPIEETIFKCKDISKFVTVRTVNGGALKEGELIGKVVRWYYGSEELDAIFYKTSGNKVPKSEGAIPVMNLPEHFPEDVDYEWYVKEAYRILSDVGYKVAA
jgi:hypothetical protein